jgi:arylsulfatase A-like enzyme
MMNAETNYGQAGMAQLDDSVGALMKALDDMGETNNTIVVFSTDNGAETFTWPDGGMTPFRASKGTIYEGGFRVPAIIRWPGRVKPGTVENGIFSGLDWYPTLVAVAGNPSITQQLLQGVKLGDQTYKNHLDGFNQVALLEGKGPSARHELFYFGGPELGAVRVDNFKYQFYTQPDGWPGPKVTTDMPLIYNIRQDPFERTPILNFAEGPCRAPAYPAHRRRAVGEMGYLPGTTSTWTRCGCCSRPARAGSPQSSASWVRTTRRCGTVSPIS